MDRTEKILDREVAWRIFAHEFNRSNLHLGEGEERTPGYIITPTGVKCNRLFVVGVVTEIDNIGQDNNLWKARVADPTGVFTVYAGQYQPESAIFLSELTIPAYVAVVGKARKYEPEDGNVYLSVRPEEINTADEKLRDRWVLDTAELTFSRIRIIEDALKSGLKGKELFEYLQKKGTGVAQADGIVRAIEHYKNIDKLIEELRTAIIHAIEAIAIDVEKEPGVTITEPEETKGEEKIAPVIFQETPAVEKPPEDEPEPKEVIAGIIDRLDTGKGIDYSGIIKAAIASGIDVGMVEECIQKLMDEGRCYEPKIGILRKV
jgi:RPA family protein